MSQWKMWRLLIVSALLLAVGAWGITLRNGGGDRDRTQPSSPTVEISSIVGVETTEGEATAWNNASKLALDSRGNVHVVYQYQYGKNDRDVLRYARSADGQTWDIEEWPGRFPALTIDGQDHIYAAYVERVPEGDRLWLKRRDPQGNWSSRELIQAAPSSLFYPSLVAGTAALHLAWETHTSDSNSIQYLNFPLHTEFATSDYTSETLVTDTQGAYFSTITIDQGGAPHLAWEGARGPIHREIDAAVRTSSGWQFDRGISHDAGGARYPALGLRPDGRVQATFVVHGEGFHSRLFTSAYEPEKAQWEHPQLLVHSEPQAEAASYAQRILAFPVLVGEMAIWGYSVPAACGVGPLFWARRLATGSWSSPQSLIGDFASFPHARGGQRGTLHLVWTDRDTEQLRAFVVRYARLRL